jgi:hypothetical protein
MQKLVQLVRLLQDTAHQGIDISVTAVEHLPDGSTAEMVLNGLGV